MIKKGVAAQKRKSTSLSTDAQLVNKVRFVLTKEHGPLRTAALTGWFLAVIYVIMVKNTVTRWVFRRKSNETAPKRGTKLSKRTQQAQRSGSLTVSTPVFRLMLYGSERRIRAVQRLVNPRPSDAYVSVRVRIPLVRRPKKKKHQSFD